MSVNLHAIGVTHRRYYDIYASRLDELQSGHLVDHVKRVAR